MYIVIEFVYSVSCSFAYCSLLCLYVANQLVKVDRYLEERRCFRLEEANVTVGQLVYFDVSCFMRSRSVFLYSFCVYSPCSVNWNGCACRRGPVCGV